MNDFERFLHASPKEGSEADDELGPLLRAAGPRPEMPARDFAEIKEAARADWQAVARSRPGSGSRWGVGLALAASLILALAVGWWWQRDAASAVDSRVATVLRVEGEALTAAGTVLEPGSTLVAGTEIETGTSGGRLALRLTGGESVRLDVSTRARLGAGNRVELEAGALYFDSADAAGHGGIQIATAFGTVRDIGTQFEVRVDESADHRLRVRVREGSVVLAREGDSHAAARGEELRLQPDGTVTTAQATPYGEEWAWVQAVAPTFDIDGQPLSRYLEWVERETGWEVVFAEPDLEASASTVILGGTIEELTADESLSVILPGSGMGYRVEEGTLLISTAESD
jgi:hypothetical protein